MESKIIVTIFPQDTQSKLRPALVLREFHKHGDFLICGVSTQLHHMVPSFDILIDKSHPDYIISGIKSPSIIRLGMLMVLQKHNVKGVIGRLSPETHIRLLKNLAEFLIDSKV